MSSSKRRNTHPQQVVPDEEYAMVISSDDDEEEVSCECTAGIERIYGVNRFYSGHAPADLVELQTMHLKILAGYKIMKDLEKEGDEELRAAKEELQVLKQELDAARAELAETKLQLAESGKEPVGRPQDVYPSPREKSTELPAGCSGDEEVSASGF
ncbi:hypothetical protein ARMSODRAFT_1013972 [Armillaria solidipes]|uniref:Uncharacterized protein n=1 Tax=Armillaria solidipes TaxID=1076256 RepID=A0A2H3BVU7_9AGAR|nr:hypothetical protein ARMSODRAFT_1013972 [Armillaria solidipes]